MVLRRIREVELLTAMAETVALLADLGELPSAARRVRTALARCQEVPKLGEFPFGVGELFPADLEVIDQRRTVACSCGCGATKPDDGLCECGQPVGH